MKRGNNSGLRSVTGVRRGVIAIGLALCMGMVSFVAPAEAGPPEDSGVVTRGDGVIGFVHVGDGYLVMTFDIEFFCNNPGPAPTGPGGMTVLPADGGRLQFTRSLVPAAVYEYAGPAQRDAIFGFLLENCGLIFDGDPSTTPAEPVATGNVWLRTSSRSHPNDPIIYTKCSFVGKMTTATGDIVSLSTQERIEIDSATGEETVVLLMVRFGG